MAQLKVTLKRGRAGKTERQLKNLTALGLTRSGKNVVVDDNPSTRGMLDKVLHLVEIERVEE